MWVITTSYKFQTFSNYFYYNPVGRHSNKIFGLQGILVLMSTSIDLVKKRIKLKVYLSSNTLSFKAKSVFLSFYCVFENLG